MRLEPKEKMTKISQMFFAGSKSVLTMFEPTSMFHTCAHTCALRVLCNSTFGASMP